MTYIKLHKIIMRYENRCGITCDAVVDANRPILINLENVTHIYKSDRGFAQIYFTNKDSILVNETFDEVLELIRMRQ